MICLHNICDIARAVRDNVDCESAWGRDADRRAKLLIYLTEEGSLLETCSHKVGPCTIRLPPFAVGNCLQDVMYAACLVKTVQPKQAGDLLLYLFVKSFILEGTP